jgi:hypothetical protein
VGLFYAVSSADGTGALVGKNSEALTMESFGPPRDASAVPRGDAWTAAMEPREVSGIADSSLLA